MTKIRKIACILSIGISCWIHQESMAAITIFGSTTTYQESGKDWLSMGTNDIDGGGGLGTDGYFFFGKFDNAQMNEQAFGNDVRLAPSYVSSFAQGAGFHSVADEYGHFGSIDHPTILDGSDTIAGVAVAFGTVSGQPHELLTFDVDGLASGQTVRVGIMSAMTVYANNDGRWDPTSITLSDGVNSATVGDHATNQLPIGVGSPYEGWVFFDIDADGSYGISATQRLATQGSLIAGVTFDSAIAAVPEPSSAVVLGLCGLLGCSRRRR